MNASPHTHFDAPWLQLRESADRAARDAAAAALGTAWITWLRRRCGARPLRVLDLGCGSGAALRWLAPRLGGEQQWLAVDHDAALLRAWPAQLNAWSARAGHRLTTGVACSAPRRGSLHVQGEGFSALVQRRRLDLASGLAALPIAATDLVSASALLDLVAERWLAELIERARAGRVVLSFALLVDGRLEWQPGIESDAEVSAWFARHQQRDKGLGGPALGARAPEVARRLLGQARYEVAEARSDWVLAAGGALQAAFVAGMAVAALQQEPAAAPAISAWRARRLAAVERSRVRVGHVEFVAVPRAGA